MSQELAGNRKTSQCFTTNIQFPLSLHAPIMFAVSCKHAFVFYQLLLCSSGCHLKLLDNIVLVSHTADFVNFLAFCLFCAISLLCFIYLECQHKISTTFPMLHAMREFLQFERGVANNSGKLSNCLIKSSTL